MNRYMKMREGQQEANRDISACALTPDFLLHERLGKTRLLPLRFEAHE